MQNIEKIAFKVVLMKFLAMHITNQEKYLDVFMIGNVQNIFMEHLFPCIYIHLFNILLIFGIQEKSIIFTIQCIFGYC